MNINHTGLIIPTSSLFKYVNDVIIKPTQLMIKHEQQSLASENDELRRNNEDLAARINQMFLEFDLVPASHNQNIENFENSKYHSGKRGTTYNSVKSKNLQEGKASKATSQAYDVADGISIYDKYCGGKSVVENRKNKDSEAQESEQVTLKVKIKENEKKNQLRQNDFKIREVSQSNLENKENFSSHLKSEIENSKLSSECESPIYIDIFDSPEKASMFFSDPKVKMDSTTDKLKPLYSNLSEITEVSENQFSLTEDNIKINKHFSVYNQNTPPKTNDSSYEIANILSKSPTANLSNLSESQKAIIDLLAKVNNNYNVLSCIYDQKHSSAQASMKIGSSQTNFELSNKSTLTSDNQSSNIGIEDDLILRKFNEQNLKIDNLAEKLLLIINKSEEEKSLTKARNPKTQFKEIESKIFYEYDFPDSPPLNNIAKYSKSLDFFMSDPLFNSNESLKNQTYKPPKQLDFESQKSNFKDTSSDVQSNDKKISNKNTSKLNSEFDNKVHLQNGKEKRSRTDFPYLSLKLSEADSWQNSDKLMAIDEALSDSEIYSFSQRKTSSKIPKRVSSINTCNTDRSTNSEDKTISKDLESSYETLYDPVLNTKVPVNDDNTFYL